VQKKEILRKLIHILFGTIIICLVAFFGVERVLPLIVFCFIAGAIISVLISKHSYVPLFSEIVRNVERHYEDKLPGQGALLFFLGTIITMAVFRDFQVVFGALIVLVYGDGFSSLIGQSIGRTRIVGNYTLEGTLFGMLVPAFLLSFFFPMHVAILASVIGMLAEFLPVEDNLTIPIATGLVLSFLL